MRAAKTRRPALPLVQKSLLILPAVPVQRFQQSASRFELTERLCAQEQGPGPGARDRKNALAERTGSQKCFSRAHRIAKMLESLIADNND